MFHFMLGIPLFLLRTILPLGLAIAGAVRLRFVLKNKNYDPSQIVPAAIQLVAAAAIWILL